MQFFRISHQQRSTCTRRLNRRGVSFDLIVTKVSRETYISKLTSGRNRFRVYDII